jgi:hypothetical protein
MALIPCKECGKEVSSGAQTCPHCGATLIKSKAFRNLLLIAAAGAVLFVGSGLIVGSKSRSEAAAEVTKLMTARGYKNVSLSYTKYVTRGDNYFTCGMAFAKDSSGAEAKHLFYVVQTGAMRELQAAAMDGEASFSRAYVDICMDSQ